MRDEIIAPFGQQYPPGTQENYNSFVSRNIMMDNELEFPNGREGGKGGTPGSPYLWSVTKHFK
jgi:hypothetical protein